MITQLGTNRLGISLTNGASTGNGPAGAIENPVISGNSITGTDLAGGKGIRFLGLIINATITRNNVRDIDRAFSGEVNNSHYATGTQAHFNNFVSNPNGFVWDGAAAVNVENNWWGCNFGPGVGGVGCSGTPNGVGGAGAANVDANPWLTLSLMALPTTVPAGGNSALTAKLTINSDDVDTAPLLSYVPDGTPVSFGATLGTVAPPNGTTVNGTASSTFTAGMTPGMGSASSTVDGQTVSQTITITCGTITLNPPTLPGGTAGMLYSQNVVASPAGTYTYAVTSGALPPGLTLDANTGALTGTPTLSGVFNFTVTATLTASPACTGSQAYRIEVTCPTVTLAPASLPNGEFGTVYSQTVTASPAGGNYSYSVTNGSLPAGLTLNASTGVVSGTPSQTGNFNFRVTATGFSSCSTFRDYQISITGCASITVNPASLPGGTIDTGYSQTVSATPAGAYSFSVTNGALPTGLTLNAATGIISGTPTTVGSFSFRVAATLDGCSGSRDYTVAIGCPTITLNPATIPAGQAGVAYNQNISVSPAGAYTFSLATGNLPSGLTLNAATGVISGVPSSTGATTFTIKAQSASGCSATQSYSLMITCPTVTLNPTTLPSGMAAVAYSQIITASPVGGNYTFAVTSGSLPAGLNLNPATGVVSGTPTANGVSTFTVTASGFGGCASSQSYTITIGGGGCPTITLANISGSASVGTLYNQSVNASPAGSYTYTLTSGAPPPGTTFYSGAALIFGYPTAVGTYNFTIQATDANGCLGGRSYSIIVRAGFAASLTVASDFDGDGKSDLSVFRGGDGNWLVANSGDGQLQSKAWGASYAPYNDLTVSGDYDGDGKTDLAVFRRGGEQAGYWFISRSSDGAIMRQHWGLGTDIPVPGDYDGDGKTDIAVWRGSAGAWYILRSSDGGVDGITWGSASVGDIPEPGDYDGDGKTDVAVFRRSDGDWHLKRSSDGITISSVWGVGTDTAVPGDYDGDGKTDLAVFRASEGNWYIMESSSAATKTIPLGAGAEGDVAVPGDYDGDGRADVAVWRESSGTWFAVSSKDGQTITKVHGSQGDTPINASRK